MLRRRPGHVLVELLLALVVGAIVVAAAVRLHVAQERAWRVLVARLGADGRARDAAAILPVTLRALAPREGDVIPTAASDTALEFRETVASAVVCAVGAADVTLPDDAGEAASLAGYLDRPQSGDTAWFLVPASGAGDDAGRWLGLGIVGVGGALCRSPGAAAPSGALRVDLEGAPIAAAIGVGVPVRVTRRARYSLYRAGDGAWYLGYRSWSMALGRLATVQPVSGPYESPARGGAPFHYFAAGGSELTTPVAAPASIARIEVRLRPARAPADPPAGSGRTVPLSVSIALRNR